MNMGKGKRDRKGTEMSSEARDSDHMHAPPT